MIEYKNPLQTPGAARTLVVDCDWPREYDYPDFQTWRKLARTSIFRNILALHLSDQGAEIGEISNFLGLSPSRTRDIINSTALRLFGKTWANFPKQRARRSLRGDSEARVDGLQYEKQYLRARTEAILFALNHTIGSHRDWELYALAGALLARSNRNASTLANAA